MMINRDSGGCSAGADVPVAFIRRRFLSLLLLSLPKGPRARDNVFLKYFVAFSMKNSQIGRDISFRSLIQERDDPTFLHRFGVFWRASSYLLTP